MIAVVDAHYGVRTARAGCVVIEAWPADRAARERAVELDGVAPYVPGELYRRELPVLIAVLDGVDAALVVVDGYVWVGEGRPGLGARLSDATGRPVVGIAKTAFPGAPAIAVRRGVSARPLWVSAIGVDPDDAARGVAAMHGEHRLPAMVVRADHLARGRRDTPAG